MPKWPILGVVPAFGLWTRKPLPYSLIKGSRCHRIIGIFYKISPVGVVWLTQPALRILFFAYLYRGYENSIPYSLRWSFAWIFPHLYYTLFFAAVGHPSRYCLLNVVQIFSYFHFVYDDFHYKILMIPSYFHIISQGPVSSRLSNRKNEKFPVYKFFFSNNQLPICK